MLPSARHKDDDAAVREPSMTEARTHFAKARDLIRQRGAGFALELTVNFILPFLIYNYGEKPLGEAQALMVSSGPPIIWSIIEFARRRRIDALSMLVLAGIGLSLLLYLGGGSVRFLQLREKLVTALIGLVFLGSAAIGRPLIYYLARATLQRRGSSDLAAFEARKDNVHFRRAMTLMTLVWGAGLVAEAALAAALVLVLSVRQYLIVGPIVGYGTMGALGLWTFLYSRRKQREGAARRAAEADAEAACSETIAAATR